MLREEAVGHAPEIDAEVVHRGAVGHGQVAGHANQHFVHDQPLGPKDHEFLDAKSGQVA